MHRSLLSWLVVFALLAAGFGATVLALNNDVFSAHGFVRSYLQALARQDADEALAFAGVVVPESEDATLLVDGALGGVGDVRLLSDVDHDGVHTVRYSVMLHGNEQITEFRVEHDGTAFGLFDSWSFAASPLARIDVTVANDSRFTANGVDAVTGVPLLVLAPGRYVIDHDSTYLRSSSETVLVATVGETTEVLLEPEPTKAFEDAAEDAVAAYLDGCVTQQVLMPTACPFGFAEANRIVGLPKWTVEEYPVVTLEPGAVAGRWKAHGSGGAVRIDVTVKSLFDGSTSQLREKVNVDGSYVLVLGDDESITVLEAKS